MTLAELDRALKGLADPTRLRLVALLLEGESCVSDLVEVLGLPQPTVSRHLATLRDSGLVSVDRDGAWSFYRLSEAGPAVPEGLTAWLAGRVGGVAELDADRRALAALRKKGGCCPATTRARRACDLQETP